MNGELYLRPGMAIIDGAYIPDELGLVAAYADERPIREAHWHPRSGDVVLDIGAAVGSYTIPALIAGARVIAVDPDKVATAKLERIARLNVLKGYEVVSEAVYDEPGYSPDMRAALEASGYDYLIPRPGATWTTLDALAERLTRLDWIKIDVEGAELGVLRSGWTTLDRFRPKLLIEDHTEVYPYVAAMDSRSQCRKLLEDLDYRITLVPWGLPPRTYLVCDPGES